MAISPRHKGARSPYKLRVVCVNVYDKLVALLQGSSGARNLGTDVSSGKRCGRLCSVRRSAKRRMARVSRSRRSSRRGGAQVFVGGASQSGLVWASQGSTPALLRQVRSQAAEAFGFGGPLCSEWWRAADPCTTPGTHLSRLLGPAFRSAKKGTACDGRWQKSWRLILGSFSEMVCGALERGTPVSSWKRTTPLCQGSSTSRSRLCCVEQRLQRSSKLVCGGMATGLWTSFKSAGKDINPSCLLCGDGKREGGESGRHTVSSGMECSNPEIAGAGLRAHGSPTLTSRVEDQSLERRYPTEPRRCFYPSAGPVYVDGSCTELTKSAMVWAGWSAVPCSESGKVVKTGHNNYHAQLTQSPAAA